MRQLLLPILLLLLLAGCKSNSIQPPQETHGGRPAITSIIPTHGRIGDQIAVYGSGLDSLRAFYVTFNGVPALVDSLSGTVIRVKVPFGASTGLLAVAGLHDTAYGPAFTVDSLCGRNLCVAGYGGPVLTEEQAWKVDCAYRFVKWSGQVRSDTVELQQSYCVGDDSHFTWILKFNYRVYSGLLPSSVDGVLVDGEILGTRVDTLKGLAEIQSWDVRGVVSGRVRWFDEEYRDWQGFVFWYDFGAGRAGL